MKTTSQIHHSLAQTIAKTLTHWNTFDDSALALNLLSQCLMMVWLILHKPRLQVCKNLSLDNGHRSWEHPTWNGRNCKIKHSQRTLSKAVCKLFGQQFMSRSISMLWSDLVTSVPGCIQQTKQSAASCKWSCYVWANFWYDSPAIKNAVFLLPSRPKMTWIIDWPSCLLRALSRTSRRNSDLFTTKRKSKKIRRRQPKPKGFIGDCFSAFVIAVNQSIG